MIDFYLGTTGHIVAVNFAIEDTLGNVVMLYLCNYPTTLDTIAEDADKLFPVGAILAIREPYFKVSIDGRSRMVRVDSPSDLIFIHPEHELLKNVKWVTGSKLPNAPQLPTFADGWKERGVIEFKAKRWLSAAICFSEALRLDAGHVLSQMNRAEAYLRLEWFNSALIDAEKSLQGGLRDCDTLYKKALFRAIKASYGLGKYEHAIKLAEARAEDVDIKAWIARSKQRLQERSAGRYDWCSLFRRSQEKAVRLDVADYVGPVEIRESGPNGIRGTFATRDIKAGELLVRIPRYHLRPNSRLLFVRY